MCSASKILGNTNQTGDAQESPIGRYRLLSESDIDTSVYAHDPHNNSLVQA